MSTRVAITNEITSLEVSFDLPSTFTYADRLVPGLGYPWEVVGISNWSVPQTIWQTPLDEETMGSWPRCDLMPPDGLLLWVLTGETRRDDRPVDRGWTQRRFQFLTARGGKTPSPDARLRPNIADLDAEPVNDVRWEGVRSRTKVVGMPDKAGGLGAEPRYLLLRAFTGANQASVRPLAEIAASISYRDV